MIICHPINSGPPPPPSLGLRLLISMAIGNGSGSRRLAVASGGICKEKPNWLLVYVFQLTVGSEEEEENGDGEEKLYGVLSTLMMALKRLTCCWRCQFW